MHKFDYLLVLMVLLLSFEAVAVDEQSLPSGIMAMRGQGTVTPDEFDARISKIPPENRNDTLRDAERVRTILANLLLTSQLVADATTDEFAQKNEQVKLRMKMAADVELANAWLEHKENTAPDADYEQLAREYYLLNQETFEVGPRVDVTHLLISTKDRSDEEAMSLAKSYLDAVKTDPSNFNELVKLHSEDPSVASNGGHLINVKKGVMVKPFEQAAFDLTNIGDFSELVHTQFGYHIIRLDQTYPSYIRPFEEVQMQLELKMATEHRQRVREEYLRSLTSMPTEISDEEIRAMINRYFDVEEDQEPPEASDNG